MAIYTAGRRRTMLILLLTSVLLITLDLRGNAVFNGIRSGFDYAFRPFEIAGEVVTRPVARIWRGMTEVDDLEAEVDRLQETVDRQRNDQIAGANAMIENQELRALLDLESLSTFDSVTAQIIGQSPSNFDQRVEIDRGSLDGIRVGMPVVNSAGLVGKVTEAFPETSIVMLATDPLYAVPVKVVAEVPVDEFGNPIEDDDEPVNTVPSGLSVGDATTTTSTSTSSTSSTTSTTSTTTTTTVPAGSGDGNGGVTAGPSLGTTTSSSSTTTTTIATSDVTRETGVLEGLGSELLPRVRFIVDSAQFGRVKDGDAVLTAGGSDSLAPPGIPVGWVANVIANPGTRGSELEVELSADLDRLNFLTVVLYVSPTEAPSLR
jgi:rod shape-determining protein MreC